MERLGLTYVDLYLIHWPVTGKIHETWRALESIYQSGKARAIGVSNFLEHHLRELLSEAGTRPAVNQVEFHPLLQQPGLRKFCADAGIQLQAWSPLIKGQVFDLPVLKQIADDHGKNAAQVTLRWQNQHGVATIPKSGKREHMVANSELFDFELSDDEMAAIDALDQNRRTGPDPDSFGG